MFTVVDFSGRGLRLVGPKGSSSTRSGASTLDELVYGDSGEVDLSS